MAAADGFVLSSAWEGLPNVVMEAMAAQLPVVATDVGGVSELVVDGESGLLVAPHGSYELAEAMLQLMNFDDERRSSMGAAGRQFVKRRFGAERVFLRWEKLFERLLAEQEQSVA